MTNVKKQLCVFATTMEGVLNQGSKIFALVFPILVLLFGILMTMGFYEPQALYANLHAFYDNFLGKILIFVILTFSLWHSANRLYRTAQMFKQPMPQWLKLGLYGSAIVGTFAIIHYL